MMKKTLIALLFLLTCKGLNSQEVSQNLSDSVSTQVAVKESSTLVKVIDWYNHHLNYATVTMLMVVESSFIPFPSEVVVPPAAYQACNPDNENLYITDSKFVNILVVIVFATLGALLGAILNYYLAFFLGRPVVYWFADSKLGHLLLLDSSKVKKAEDYFIKHGNSSTFIGRLVPGIRQLISIPAGLAKMKLGPFILFTVLGSAAWNIILAILGYIAHGQQDIINQYSHELSMVLLGLGIIFVIYLIYKGFKKKSQKVQKTNMNK